MTSIKQLNALKRAREAKRKYAAMYLSQKATDPQYQAYLEKKRLARIKRRATHTIRPNREERLQRLRAAKLRKEGETD